MNEKPKVSRILRQAENLYSEYKFNHGEKERAEGMLASSTLEDDPDIRSGGLPFGPTRRRNAKVLKTNEVFAEASKATISETQEKEDRILSASKRFADEFADELYDGSLVSAELDGVSINTKRTILIGNKALDGSRAGEDSAQPIDIRTDK